MKVYRFDLRPVFVNDGGQTPKPERFTRVEQAVEEPAEVWYWAAENNRDRCSASVVWGGRTRSVDSKRKRPR